MLSPKLPWELASTKWSSELNPVLNNPLTNPRIINGVSLVSGVNVINHGLGRTQQGWFFIDIDGAAQIYRSAPFNSTTLTLTSDADVNVSLGVF